MPKYAKVLTPLLPHQQRVIDKLKASGGVLVAHGVGSGKTLTSIAATDALGLPADVIVPAPLVTNYEKELDKHLDNRPKGVVIRSYEKAVRDRDERPVNTKGLVILDEAQRARNAGTQLAESIADPAQSAKARLLLTGTPVYNQPSDVAALLNIAAGKDVLPRDPTAFKQTFVGERTISPSLWGKLLGAKPVKEPVLVNRNKLIDAATGYVDVQRSGGEHFPSRIDEAHDVQMSPKQWEKYRYVSGKMPWYLEYKVKSGLPLTKAESKDLNAFEAALRQVSNTPRGYDTRIKEHEELSHSPKLRKVVDHALEQLKANPQHKGVIYSNYLESGLQPISRALAEAGVPHSVFHGGVSKTEKAQMVKDYNEGRKPLLLISASGAEGLDLKGTRSIQVVEPHWNEGRIGQVIGRGIRYKSHEHLPEDQRNVKVMRYYSAPPSGMLDKIFGNKDMAIERYMQMSADKKDALGRQIMEALEEASARGPKKTVP